MRVTNTINVGVLGATGLVGQRFLALITGHSRFKVIRLGGSEASANSTYGKVMSMRWRLAEHDLPEEFSEIVMVPCTPEHFSDCVWVFSAIDAAIAGPIERAFVEAGISVFTNSSAHRMTPGVPLVVPTANPQALRGIQGPVIIANSNCTTAGVAVVLAALLSSNLPKPKSIIVQSMQAASGGGNSPGISVVDLADNIIPYIGGGEEEKMQSELPKILGINSITVSMSCNRVPITDGHMVNISIGFEGEVDKEVSAEQVMHILRNWNPLIADLKAESWPRQPIIVFDQPDRPQPRFDRKHGMSVMVGRVRSCPVLDVRMTILIHNTILGAAGSALLNAEIFYS